MRNIILTIAAVLTLISCAPEEEVVIDNSVEPVTNNDSEPEPTPEPEPEPELTPFGEWVTWGYYSNDWGRYRTVPILDTPTIVLNEDGSIVMGSKVYGWVEDEEYQFQNECRPFALIATNEYGLGLTASYSINNSSECWDVIEGLGDVLIVETYSTDNNYHVFDNLNCCYSSYFFVLVRM